MVEILLAVVVFYQQEVNIHHKFICHLKVKQIQGQNILMFGFYILRLSAFTSFFRKSFRTNVSNTPTGTMYMIGKKKQKTNKCFIISVLYMYNTEKIINPTLYTNCVHCKQK